MVLVLAILAVAFGHGPDAHRVEVELEGPVARITATPPATMFAGADVDGDGRLSRAEVGAARPGMRRLFATGFEVSDSRGQKPICDEASISTIGEGADYVRVSLRCRFEEDPEGLVLRTAFVGAEPFIVEAVQVERVADNRWSPTGPVQRGLLAGDDGRINLFKRSVPADGLSVLAGPVGFGSLLALALFFGWLFSGRSALFSVMPRPVGGR